MSNHAILHFDDLPPCPPGQELPDIGALIRQLNDILEAAQAAQSDTENARDAAEESEGNAEHYAEMAGQTVAENGYMWLYIDETDGCIYFDKTPNVPYTFFLGDDGCIYAEYAEEEQNG